VVQFDAAAIGKRIREQRKYRGWSLATLAARLRDLGYVLTPKAIQQWETGQRKLANEGFQEAVAHAFNWRSYAAMMASSELEPPPALRLPDDLGTVVDKRSRAGIQEVSRVPIRPVAGGNANALRGSAQPPQVARLLITPLMGVRVLSVHPQDQVNADVLTVGDHVEVDGAVAIPTEMAANRTLWAVRVSGSCMEPEISAGDVVIIEIGRAPMDGEVVVVEYEGRTLVKRWWDEGPRVHLVANRDGDSVDAAKEDVVVIGVVVSGVYEVIRQPRRYRRAG
jgi:transcriptional regulator with XRE-family HTH domain